MVFTRKAGAGVRRARAVCCGNYSETRFSTDCYAGGADGCQVRALIRTAALKSWAVAATDIRVAFLNAPRREDGKLVAMEIPHVYKRLGLAREGEVWLVKLAMYGLTTSPRDWSQYRDRTLPMVSWVRMKEDRKVRGHFVKTADENLWRLEEEDVVSGECYWTGLMSVYVDDILLTGEEVALSSALTSLQATWTTSSVEWASPQNPVHFCGFEVKTDEKGDGFHLSQQKYEQEILARWNVKESSNFPNFKITEEDFEAQGETDIRQVREAQALAGSLLWLSTRSRPDLALGVAVVSRMMTRNPKKAVEVAHTLLAYIKGTPGDLHYTGQVHQVWGARGQLKIPRHGKLIEVYADIAYGTGSGHRSSQGLAIYFAGAPIAWQSSSQPFVTHSTAEAELVSYCEALTSGRATEALLCTMWGEELKNNTFDRVIYGDNAAAISLAHGNSATSWRTRHLRVRSNLLREALENNSPYPGGAWKLMHLRGTELVADGLTKPLLGQSFQNFLSDLGLKGEEASLKVIEMDRRQPLLQEQNGADRRPPQVHDQAAAARALLAGSVLVRTAEAQGSPAEDSTVDALWICGLILIAIGAIWVGSAIYASMHCCLRRLHQVTIKPRKKQGSDEEEEKESSTSADEDGGADVLVTTPQSLRTRNPQAQSDEATMSSRSPMTLPTRRRSGPADGPTSVPTRRRSGSADGSTSMPTQRQSGSADRSVSSSRTSRDVAEAASKAAGDAEEAAVSAQLAARAADRAAASVERASMILHGALQGPMSMPSSSSRASTEPENPWNKFQKQHARRGWTREKMRAEYYKAKCQCTPP